MNIIHSTSLTWHQPIAPKWKTSETLLDDFCKFKQSCQRIFDGILHLVRSRPACYLSGQDQMGRIFMKISTSCLTQKYDIDYVFRKFKEFCKPICNFCMARLNDESVDVFYILKIARQCEFPDMDDCIIDAIIFGTNCIKARTNCYRLPRLSCCSSVYLL